MPILHNGLQVDLSVCKWTFGLSMLDNIFPLHTIIIKTQNYHHLKEPNVLHLMPLCNPKSREFFGHNRSKSSYFQVQPVHTPLQ